MAQCPECEAMMDLETDDLEEGQLVSCPECGVDLEVVNTNPIEFDLAMDEDEDEDEEVEDDLEEEDEDLDDMDDFEEDEDSGEDEEDYS